MAPIRPTDTPEDAGEAARIQHKTDDSERGRAWGAIRWIAAACALTGAVTLALAAVTGIAEGWLPYAPIELGGSAVASLFIAAIAGVTLDGDRKREAISLAVVALGLAVAAALLFHARDDALADISEAKAECAERRENAISFTPERAFEAGIAYHRAGCTHLPETPSKATSPEK